MGGSRATSRDKLTVRQTRRADIPAVVECQLAAYPGLPPESLTDERKMKMQIAAFPQGQFVAEIQGRIVGYTASLIVDLDEESPWYSYDEITGVGTFSTHNVSGDTLYGADIAVHPDFRGRGIAGKLYQKRKSLMRRFNLRRMVAGGRIPGYREHSTRLTASEYVEAVKRGELRDSALTAHIKAGYEIRSVHYGYLSDRGSMNYATYLELENPHFDPAKRLVATAPIGRRVRKVRVCAAQYEMRPITVWGDLVRQVRFFADTAHEYHSNFLLMPELFTAQVFSMLPREMESRAAVVEVAKLYPDYLQLFKELAAEFELYIIAGSTFRETDGEIRNTAHLFTPTGGVHVQDKLHITPVERLYYGTLPGDAIRVFDTPLGRIGIVVCYDVEFPELVRVMALAGIEILFVPFATDERKSYFRVRHCAQARAVENVIYVVLAGCVGNLPQVRSFLINYGQAAICTPCDIAFPKDGILAEADPNTETAVVAELDLNGLAVQRDIGSVRPLQDRRDDIYEVRTKHAVEIVRVQ